MTRTPPEQHLHFGRFQLDLPNARLLHDGQPMPLTPKAFDVLAFLCKHPGRLIGKEVLLDTVWQRRFITEGVLKNTIQELRRALGDDPKSPRFIETVHRRGYRFVGKSGEQARPDDLRKSAAVQVPADAANIVVGRNDALNHLQQWLGLCLAGQPQTVFLSGEPGIGKTTLVRQFSATLPESTIVVAGQCVGQHGEVEPYLPFLEALNQLGRRCGQPLSEGLRRYAPTWLAQLPWLQTEADRGSKADAPPELSKERMHRELGAFLDHWSSTQPHALILVLEDLHWSDHATLDAIAYLARQREAARWMILGSYRPVDMLVNAHPLRRVMGELHLHRLCHDVALFLLPEASVMEYLAQRFSGNPLSYRMMRAIHQRTEGLPLYMVRLSNELAAWREQHPGCTDREMEDFFETLPESLKRFIEQQFDRLPAESQVFLDTAAVGGKGFSADMLAAVTGNSILVAEDWCEGLARDRHILTRSGPPHQPERRYSGRYAFIHAYYQRLAYERIPMLRRSSLHLAVAEWFEASCGMRVRDLAAEIAMHFEQGRNYERALYYFRIAVGNALGRHEAHAVSALSRRALDILERHLPDIPEHTRVTIELYTTLVAAMQVTHGWAAPELLPVFDRLLHHDQTLEQSPYRLQILWGLLCFHYVRGHIRVAEQYAERVLALDHGESCREVLICGHVGLMSGRLYSGRLESALNHFRTSQALYRPEHRGMFPLMAIHPVVLSHFFATQVHWLRGFPDLALRCAEEGIAVAQADAQPYSLAFIQWGEIICRQLRGEADMVETSSQALIAQADEKGFTLVSAVGGIQQGWALARQGQTAQGIDVMRRGIAEFRATGGRLSETFLLAYCVDVFLQIELAGQGTAMLDEAFEFMENNGERFFEAELYRLRGELVRDRDPTEAERHYHTAIDVARQQGARSLELRAAMSLARLWPDQARNTHAMSMLHDIYATFREGLDTRDLRVAKQLLEDWHAHPAPIAACTGPCEEAQPLVFQSQGV